MLEFQRRELEFKLDEKQYRIKFPSVKQMAEFQKEHDSSEDKFAVTIGLLTKLGLDKKTVEDMEMPHLSMILEALTAEKK